MKNILLLFILVPLQVLISGKSVVSGETQVGKHISTTGVTWNSIPVTWNGVSVTWN
jgi:hypothetical protein